MDQLNLAVTTLQTTTPTKNDLDNQLNNLRTQLATETETRLTAALTPLTTDVQQLNTTVTQLNERVTTLENKPQQPATTQPTTNPTLAATLKRQQATLNRLDPAHTSITFIGFNDTFTQLQRKKYLTDLLRLNVPNATFTSIDTIYRGPYNKRVPTANTTVTFTNQETRDDVLDKLQDLTPTTPDGKQLRLAKTKTQQQLSRNS